MLADRELYSSIAPAPLLCHSIGLRFPPALVVLSKLAAGSDATLALVGKGIVYDTGGMQIKTKTGMPGMKRDMGGAAAVLNGFAAAVKAGVGINLHCLLCLAENNISPAATKPDDIITMLSGKTVEVCPFH